MVPAASPGAILRQLGVLVGIAASVALGMWVVMWARQPQYDLLYTNLNDRDLSQVVSTLQTSGVPYRIEPGAGTIMVASDKVGEMRMKLASAGVPKNASMGLESLGEDQGLGTSRFVELARYQHALEGELARTIASITNVRNVRVHIAAPKDTAFMREQAAPSASVFVDLYSGHALDENQIGAIVHLVASSVPGLSPARVTVIDQNSRLLTSGYGQAGAAVSQQALSYVRSIEREYATKIENMLAAVVGADGVRAQVTAEVDLAAVEETSQEFSQDQSAVRSERIVTEERSGGIGAGGVPGALSNEPPAQPAAPETTQDAGQGGGGSAAKSAVPQSKRSEEVRNLDPNVRIAHTKKPAGNVRRLSAAVVVNHKAVRDAAGKVTYQALSAQELKDLTALAKDAIAFDAARGDTVNVINTAFKLPDPIAPLPEAPLWERPWFWSVAKQVLGGLFVLFIALGVIRPAMRNLMKREAAPPAAALPVPAAGANGAPALPGPAGADGAKAAPDAAASTPALPAAGAPGLAQLSAGTNSDLEMVRNYASQEPKLAAQVIKAWVGEE